MNELQESCKLAPAGDLSVPFLIPFGRRKDILCITFCDETTCSFRPGLARTIQNSDLGHMLDDD